VESGSILALGREHPVQKYAGVYGGKEFGILQKISSFVTR
jgi:hypothetical protein